MPTLAAGSRAFALQTHSQSSAGFTLVEVLVSLAIVASVLAAGLGSMSALALQAERQTDLLFARLCADNWVAGLRLGRRLPDLGERKLDCEQAGRTYAVTAATSVTPNPNFRRVDVSIHRDGAAVIQVSTVVGRY